MLVMGVGGWMADVYIKRSELLELAREYYTNGQGEEAVPVKVIKNIPSADVAPVVHGEWLVLDDRWEFEEVKCSNCGCVEYFNKGWKKFNYCPHCGARMDGE